MTELTGAVVLVVGASGGLGSRIAGRLSARGATVVRASRGATARDDDHGGAGASRGSGLGGGVSDLRGDGAASTTHDLPLDDLRDESATSTLVARVLELHDRLDGVVIAAGVVAFGPAVELGDGALQELFEVNALAPIRLIRDSAPYLAESAKRGRSPFIVTLSGIVSEVPTSGLAAYSAAKAALAAFAVASTRELRRSGIRIIDARPGHTETGLSKHPIEGAAPAFPAGLDPDHVAERIVQAIAGDERDLPSTAFHR